jgi:hypothetical protein
MLRNTGLEDRKSKDQKAREIEEEKKGKRRRSIALEMFKLVR